MTKTNMTIPELLIAMQEEAGLTQYAAAEKAGVSPGLWSRYIHGHRQTTLKRLKRFAKKLGYTVAFEITPRKLS